MLSHTSLQVTTPSTQPRPPGGMKEAWGTIRWRMLLILVLFGLFSTLLIAAVSVAVLNVVVRRESSYLIEERMRAMIETDARVNRSTVGRVEEGVAPLASVQTIARYLSAVWPDSHTRITLVKKRPTWFPAASFTGIIADGDHLVIRSYHEIDNGDAFLEVYADTAITKSFLADLSKAAGVQLAGDTPVRLLPYRAQEGIAGEIFANFVPGSHRAIPVVVTATDWSTGKNQDWVICQVRLNYARTIADLSKMGLQTASWVTPFALLLLALAFVYISSLILSIRLSQHISAAIDDLSSAAHRVGEGDLSVQLPTEGRDQMGLLAGKFNSMVRDLHSLREQEKQAAMLEWDLSLARQVQEHLYPRQEIVVHGATVWGTNTPARAISGDLYEFFSFNQNELGLLCADVSGKGAAAALMMAHLQALVHGRLISHEEGSDRMEPGKFVAALNRDFCGRFGEDRYFTMFYAEFDFRTGRFHYINAGHCPAILITPGEKAQLLGGGNLPVGIIPEATYASKEVTLPKGSAIIVYTDGITDAVNAEGEPFGEQRLQTVCESLPQGATSKDIGTSILQHVAEWESNAEQFDDTTILVLTVE
jgi:serine phosphatase RsbU (regulator of sigma subunit)